MESITEMFEPLSPIYSHARPNIIAGEGPPLRLPQEVRAVSTKSGRDRIAHYISGSLLWAGGQPLNVILA